MTTSSLSGKKATQADDVARLRQQNHDAAVAHDREIAVLRSRVARYENAFARARELVRGTPVDWTDDLPSKRPDGWWAYTSQQNREIITAAVLNRDSAIQRLVEAATGAFNEVHDRAYWNDSNRTHAKELSICENSDCVENREALRYFEQEDESREAETT